MCYKNPVLAFADIQTFLYCTIVCTIYMNKAVFFDRDGTINEMVFEKDEGIVHTPLTPDQVVLDHGIIALLRTTKKLGYLNIVVSNQANVGLGRISRKMHEKINQTINRQLDKENVRFDKEYYCFHHPFAKVKEYRKDCDCRKPKAGLFRQAAKELDIDLKKSWMIGDGVFDIVAGHQAGCKTILIANVYESSYLSLMEKKLSNIQPDFMVRNVKDIIPIFNAQS